MKNCIPSFVIVVVVALCLSSCTALRIEKRQYRDGYYLGGKNHVRILKTDSVVCDINSISESRCAAYENLPESSMNLIDTLHNTKDSVLIVARDTFSNIHEPKESGMSDSSPIDGKLSQKVPGPDPVPAEARVLNTWWWISLGMLVLGVIASIVAFMPFVAAGFGVLIASAPFLVLGALGIGIWLMVAARRRKLSAGSPEISNYYDKLRKRARLIVILASTVIVVFILFLALIIAALSTFQ